MGPFAEYTEHLKAGRFCLQKCRACGDFTFSPRLFCSHCKNGDYEWREASGAGQVYALTVIGRSAAKGGNYNVVLVDLDEGPRMMSRVVGIDTNRVQIGMRVQAVISRDDDGPLVEFQPA